MAFKNMRSRAMGIFGNPMAYDPNWLTNGIAQKWQDDEAEVARMEALGQMQSPTPMTPQDFAKQAMMGKITPEQYANVNMLSGGETPAEPAKKGKFFGEGGFGRIIAGAIGDALLNQAKMEPLYGPEMARRAAAQRALDAENKQTESLLKVWAAKNNVPENIELSDGTVVRVGADGSAAPVYQGKPKQTDFMQNVNYVDNLRITNPELYKRLIGGGYMDVVPGLRRNSNARGGKPKAPLAPTNTDDLDY